MKLFKDIPIGEWCVIRMTFSGINEYAFYRFTQDRHIEYVVGLSDPLVYERTTTNVDLNYEVVDWFEDPKYSGRCLCPIQQLMGNGCICSAIIRYNT